MVARVLFPALAPPAPDVSQALIALMAFGFGVAMHPNLGSFTEWNHRFCASVLNRFVTGAGVISAICRDLLNVAFNPRAFALKALHSGVVA